jgi:2-aminoadipate transaminase
MNPDHFSRAALSALGRRTEAPPISWLMELTLQHPKLISLAAGFTDNATLPVRETRALMAALLQERRTGEPALQYGNTVGLPRLAALTAARVLEQDASTGEGRPPTSRCQPDQLVLTHGSQQLLYMVAEVLLDPGDIVLVEDPTYFVFLGILQSRGVECRGVPLEPDGLDVSQLEAVLARLKRERRLSRLKLVYLVTYHQNPSGTTTCFAKKAAVLDLLRFYERAAGHAIYLLEDAAYRELRFRGPDTASALAASGGNSRVLYAGTYSKPYATGVRVGFGFLPEPIRTAVIRVKGNQDFGTSNLLQHLLAQAIASGRYDRHVRELRRRYAEKAGWMAGALRRHFSAEVSWVEPDGGMYFWARLPGRRRSGPDSTLFQRALEANVLYVPGGLCYAPDPTRRKPDRELRLSFGNASRREIQTGIRRLGEVLRATQES